jgi:hypothetical protein
LWLGLSHLLFIVSDFSSEKGADKMLVTGIIVLGVAVYAVWAVRKIRKDRKNGSCCGGSCSGCVGKEYCSK